MNNDRLKQTGFDNLLGGCALAAIASAPASIIQSVNYFFDHNHTFGLLNISALHVQCGIQAFAKFKRPECARLYLRELHSQHSRPQCLRVWECARKLWETLRRSSQNLAIWASQRMIFDPTKLFASFVSASSRKSCATSVLQLKKFC